METDKLQEILKDENFVREILEMKTAEEVQKAFENKSIKLTIAEIELLFSEINRQIREMLKSKKDELISDTEFENIAGGNKRTQFCEGYLSGYTGPAYAYSKFTHYTEPTSKKERFCRYAGIAIGTRMAAGTLGFSWIAGAGGELLRYKLSKK